MKYTSIYLCISWMIACFVLGCSQTTPQERYLERGQMFLADANLNTDDDPDNDLPEELYKASINDAMTALNEGIAAYPQQGALYYERALAWELQNEPEKAIADYQQAAKLMPERSYVHNNLAAALAKQGDFSGAAVSFSQAIKLNPKDSLAWRNRGLAYHDMKDFPAALQDYDTALEIDPNSAEAWFLKGNVYLETREHKQALECFHAALKINPLHARAYFNRSKTREALGDSVGASEDKLRALEFEPTLADVQPESAANTENESAELKPANTSTEKSF